MHFILETKKTKNEILQIISDNTCSNTAVFGASQSSTYFEGTIYEDSFKIQRCIHYRNTFLPIIKGVIEEHDTGSKVTMSIQMNALVIGFLCIWFTGVILACLAMFLVKFSIPFWFIPYVLLLLGIVIVIVPNNIEAKKVKEKLSELLA